MTIANRTLFAGVALLLISRRANAEEVPIEDIVKSYGEYGGKIIKYEEGKSLSLKTTYGTMNYAWDDIRCLSKPGWAKTRIEQDKKKPKEVHVHYQSDNNSPLKRYYPSGIKTENGYSFPDRKLECIDFQYNIICNGNCDERVPRQSLLNVEPPQYFGVRLIESDNEVWIHHKPERNEYLIPGVIGIAVGILSSIVAVPMGSSLVGGPNISFEKAQTRANWSYALGIIGTWLTTASATWLSHGLGSMEISRKGPITNNQVNSHGFEVGIRYDFGVRLSLAKDSSRPTTDEKLSDGVRMSNDFSIEAGYRIWPRFLLGAFGTFGPTATKCPNSVCSGTLFRAGIAARALFPLGHDDWRMFIGTNFAFEKTNTKFTESPIGPYRVSYEGIRLATLEFGVDWIFSRPFAAGLIFRPISFGYYHSMSGDNVPRQGDVRIRTPIEWLGIGLRVFTLF